MSSHPPLPPGFTLDTPQGASSADIPPLPAGFTLDSAAPSRPLDADGDGMQDFPDISAEPAPDHASQAKRAGGLTARSVAQGVTDLAYLGPDLLTMLDNLTHPGGYTVTLADGTKVKRGPTPLPSQQRDQALTQMGLPEPETPGERVIGGVQRGLAGGGATIGAARQAAGTGATMLQRVMAKLADAPGGQAIAIGSGSAAGGITREMGGGPIAQFLASMAGAVLPGVGGRTMQEMTRRAFRGGEEGRQAVQQTVEDFSGVTGGKAPSVGQATQGRTAQATESMLSRTPGAAGRMVSAAETQADDIGAGVERMATTLAPKASGEQAGRAIERGVREGFIPGFRAKQERLYGELDKHISPDAQVAVSKTLAALDKLTTPTKGAEATSSKLINSKISSIAEGLAQDAQNGQVPYGALRELRTRVGQELDSGTLVDSVPKAQWKALYAALSQDLGAAARTAGDKAQQAWSRANHYTKAGMDRIEAIESVLSKNGGPEAVFRAATANTKEGATTLRAVMQSLDNEGRKMVSATVLRRLGRAKAGVQDASGEKFSTETFLTNWNSLSAEAKRTLFGRYGNSFQKDMDKVARVASNLRQGSKVFQNPSGTQQAISQQSTAFAILLPLLTGHYKTAAGVAGTVGAANLVASKVMTNPDFVRFLAKTTEAPKSAVPAMLNELVQSKDAELREVGEMLLSQTVPTGAAQ